MTANGWLQILVFAAAILAVTKPRGVYMYRVFEGSRQPLPRLFGPIERVLYRACGIDPTREQTWTEYTLALLVFSALGVLVTYALQRLQGVLPLNPQGFGAVTPDLSFNTAVSFATNTNWQSYSGEGLLSYLTQMLGLSVQNFVSAATGMAVLVALIRGLARRTVSTIGNFWVDLTRSALYILLPLSLVLATVLMSQGVVQTFKPYQAVEL